MQILQQIFGVLAVGGKVRGNDVHVIAGAHGLFLFLNGHLLQVAHFALDILDGLCLVDRLDMQADGHGVVHIQELCQQLVRQLRCQDLQKGHRPGVVAHTEGLAVFGEGQPGERNEILGGKAGLGKLTPIKAQQLLTVRVELTVQQLQTLDTV